MKCEVCGTVTLLRIQIGFRERHPIRFSCGKCGISMRGTVEINKETTKIEINVDNCTKIDEEVNYDYYLEVSPELLTEKLRKANCGSDNDLITPFLKNIEIVGDDKFLDKSSKLLRFFDYKNEEWPKVRRIIELYLQNNMKYVIKEIHSILPVKQFPCDSGLELHRGVHTLFIHSILSICDENFVSQTCRFIDSENMNLLKSVSKEYNQLIISLENENYFIKLEHSILKLTCDFFQVYDYIQPVLLISSVYQLDNTDESTLGLSTCDFSDLKQFYIDTYEFLAESMLLPTLLNNLKYRGRVEEFNNSLAIDSISKYKASSKGKKIEFCKIAEVYNRLFKINLNNKIRNAIGHNSYKYDGKTQLIEFIDHKNPDKNINMYLIEFAEICLYMYHSVINIQELLYKTRKMYFISRGDKAVSAKVFGAVKQEKIGRNEPCICGSGLKYKKCCGK
ncbi:SEC-C metal-binding domain-containing protein [Fusibacter sp. 3D3]|uniref:SEC-C metal-binding domain-containing protein n=1 Tax=Fusibacter sp. 3D3 TaxID=1048380 RepID=UPI001585F7EE|nr:SEC-C metal-binding domain-containing protein [Fusibacter sp. 3D3]